MEGPSGALNAHAKQGRLVDLRGESGNCFAGFKRDQLHGEMARKPVQDGSSSVTPGARWRWFRRRCGRPWRHWFGDQGRILGTVPATAIRGAAVPIVLRRATASKEILGTHGSTAGDRDNDEHRGRDLVSMVSVRQATEERRALRGSPRQLFYAMPLSIIAH